MARLSGERQVTLGASTTVGRDPSCALLLEERRVSSLHARFSWTGAAWVLRDLGSTNGTFVDGVRLPPGVDRRVHAGMRLAFGDPGALWVLDDSEAPRARAVDVATGYDGVEATVTAAEVLPWGVRIEVRLDEPAEETLDIPVDVVARTAA